MKLTDKELIDCYFRLKKLNGLLKRKAIKIFRANTYRNELWKSLQHKYKSKKKLRELFRAFDMPIIAYGQVLNCPVWGTLTFDNDHIEQDANTKRKQVLRQLNNYLLAFVYVEEYGEENGRYHVHFIGLMRDKYTYNDFIASWHSRCEIKKVSSQRQAIDYLCDYLKKSCSKLHLNSVAREYLNMLPSTVTDRQARRNLANLTIPYTWVEDADLPF